MFVISLYKFINIIINISHHLVSNWTEGFWGLTAPNETNTRYLLSLLLAYKLGRWCERRAARSIVPPDPVETPTRLAHRRSATALVARAKPRAEKA